MDERLSTEVLHALAHPVRLSALLALEQRERTPTELAAALDIREPVLMSHLHLLDAAGLIAPVPESDLLRVRSTGWAEVAQSLQQMQDASAGDRARGLAGSEGLSVKRRSEIPRSIVLIAEWFSLSRHGEIRVGGNGPTRISTTA